MRKNSLTIAYLIDSLSYGGAERQLDLLVRALPPTITPVIISLSEDIDPFGTALRKSGFDVVAIERRAHMDVKRLWEAVRAIRSRGTGLVHGFLDAANAYAYASARTLRLPVMLSLQSEILRVPGARGAVLSMMLRRADRVLVNSTAGAELLRTRIGVSEGRILHIRNWIDPSRLGGPRDLPSAGSHPTIGFVGRFAPAKRLTLLVEVFQNLLRIIPDARLVLQGDGSDRADVIERVERMGLGESVRIVPPDPDVAGTLRRLHAFVLTSSFEGLPNAAIEALSMGVPIVATDVGDLGELVIDGKTGTFFRNDDPSSMAETLAGVLADRALIESAHVSGPRLVEEKFSLSKAVDRLVSDYAALADRKGRRV
jgi:glycosyltransferase involved in cell wall biosynthesis